MALSEFSASSTEAPSRSFALSPSAASVSSTLHAPIRLIALDLDDTLLRADLTISEKSKEALQRADSMGAHIVLASGRNYYSMRRYADELLIHRRGDYLIGSNGAQLIQASSGRILEELTLPRAFCVEMANELDTRGAFWQVYIDGAIYCNRMNPWAVMDHELSGLPLRVLQDEKEKTAILARDQTKILICGEAFQIELLYQELAKRFEGLAEVVTSKPYFLEILPKGASKGAALERLAKRLHIRMDEVLAIGDARNDIDMLQKAGWGCAPANAAEEVRAIARFVSSKTNEEDAVADILAHVVFGV